MSYRTVEKAKLGEVTRALKELGYEVWGPKGKKGQVELGVLNGSEDLVLDFANTTLSPKGFVFPESEKMFLFSTDREREDAFILKEIQEDPPKRALLGVRPCDARAFVVLDKVFLQQGAYPDPYYRQKREKTLLIALGCNWPCLTCFCHWTGGGPFEKEGSDLLMVDLDGVYLIGDASPKGKEVLEWLELPEASQDEVQRAGELAKDALESMGEARNPNRLRERPLMELFDDPVWERLHETCVKCGACTYLCPTCSCFDIQDEVRGPCGFRGRNWDTCMFALTTQHASGHNPRPTGRERFRQRFMHKLKYYFDDFGMIMCVGCGRCVQHCPVNIDIREIIETLSA
jgi:ferredoxin